MNKNIIFIIIAVALIAGLGYFLSVKTTEQSPTVSKDVSKSLGIKGECPGNGRFEGSSKKLEEIFTSIDKQKDPVALLDFIAKHPIVCDLNQDYQLIYKVNASYKNQDSPSQIFGAALGHQFN